MISIVFQEPWQRHSVYNTIDLSKGPSLRTTFNLVLPYAQLAHAYELDWTESQDMPKHIVRISVGLEEVGALITKSHQALQGVEALN